MNGNFDNGSDEYSRLTFLFFRGASCYVLKDCIPFNRSTFFVLLAVIAERPRDDVAVTG